MTKDKLTDNQLRVINVAIKPYLDVPVTVYINDVCLASIYRTTYNTINKSQNNDLCTAFRIYHHHWDETLEVIRDRITKVIVYKELRLYGAEDKGSKHHKQWLSIQKDINEIIFNDNYKLTKTYAKLIGTDKSWLDMHIGETHIKLGNIKIKLCKG